MKLNRLTNRARIVIESFSSTDLVRFDRFFDEIDKSKGMGNTLLQAFPELRKVGKTAGSGYKSVSVSEVVKKAYYHSLRFNQTYVGTEHLLLALLTLGDYPDSTKVEGKLIELSSFPSFAASVEIGKKTPILDAYGFSLNHKVASLPKIPIVFREELNTLVSILLQKKNSNPLVVGDPSVGKRTLIDLLVRKINEMDVPPSLMGYRVIEFDLLAFVTATFGKGSMETSLEALYEELRSVGRVILSIKNFQSLFYSTNMGVAVPLVFSAFKSGLDESNIKCVATISDSFYSRIISDNEHMLEGFTIINLSEPEEKKVMEILRANAEVLSEFHRISISNEIVDYIYDKAKDEIANGKFPQKGIDLMDQACAKFILRKRKVPENYKTMIEESVELTENLDKSIHIGNYDNALEIKGKLTLLERKMWGNEKKMFSKRKYPLTIEDVDEALDSLGVGVSSVGDLRTLATLDDRIAEKIIGQKEAVNTVTKSLMRSKLGLRPKKRPIGSFLFLGPTGVGKTELAKVLAEEAFDEGSLIRLDMSDFAEKHNVARLVGAPPGYVGYGEGGELTTKIDLKPDSVVLFDEIEKAHPDVLNILLQIMEEGELVDARGTPFDFSKALIILTSNLGTNIIHGNVIGFDEKILDDSKLEDRLKNNLKKILKPELLNRLDEVVVFKRLNKIDQMKILNILLDEVKNTLKKQDVAITIGADIKAFLLKEGYSDEYGARALRRTVEKVLLDPIAQVLLTKQKRPLKLGAAVVKSAIKVNVLK